MSLKNLMRPRRAMPPVFSTLAVVVVAAGMAAPAQRPEKPQVQERIHDVSRARVRPGFSRTVETGLPTSAIGVVWDGGQEGAVEVRARHGDDWGPWFHVEGNPEEGPDTGSREDRRRVGAGPIWVGPGADDVEVRVVEGELENVRLHALRSEATADEQSGRMEPSAATVGRPRIITRQAWGADESWRTVAAGCSGRPDYAPSVRFAVVHHTVNPNTYAATESAAMMRAIYRFHTHSQAFCDIGYNFVVDRFGQVFEGRFGGVTAAVVGAHARGFNTGSTGVSLLGDFRSDAVPPVMYSALRGVLAWKLAYHGVDPQSMVAAGGRVIPAIIGHRDVDATECPGQLAYNVLASLRAQVAGDIQAAIFKPVIVRSAVFYLRNWQTTGNHHATFTYGNATDIPLFCDWNGRGPRTVGAYRPSTATFYLRFSNSTGVADRSFVFGDPGDRPICGDWNGDGVDTVGIVRNANFHLRQTNTAGMADVSFSYGVPTDLPVAGDWNGDGRDTPGVFRAGKWFLRNSTSSGVADLSFGYGDATDVPVAGDWNGDGIDTPGVFRGGNWYLANRAPSASADVVFGFGDAGDVPRAWR